jgi:hypothetical protein
VCVWVGVGGVLWGGGGGGVGGGGGGGGGAPPPPPRGGGGPSVRQRVVLRLLQHAKGRLTKLC